MGVPLIVENIMEMECIALKINVRSIGPRQLLVLQEWSIGGFLGGAIPGKC